MVTLQIQPPFLAALWARASFEAATDDAAINTELLSHVRVALTESSVAVAPGHPVLLTLGSGDELNALTACFEGRR